MTRKGLHPFFDPTINLGHLISIAAVIVTISGGWYVFDYRLSAIEKNMGQLSSVVIDAARTSERLNYMDARLQRLENK